MLYPNSSYASLIREKRIDSSCAVWKRGRVERWKGGKVERWKGGKVGWAGEISNSNQLYVYPGFTLGAMNVPSCGLWRYRNKGAGVLWCARADLY